MTVRTCALCGNDIGLGEGFHLGTGVNREVAKHATCLAVWEWRRRAEKAEAEVASLRAAIEVLDAGPGYCPDCAAHASLLGAGKRAHWSAKIHSEDCIVGLALKGNAS